MYHVEILFFLRLAHRLSLISYYVCFFVTIWTSLV